MKEILIISPFSLQGTYVKKNLQKKVQNVQGDTKKFSKKFLDENFFSEKKLDKLYQLKNKFSNVNCLYFVITKQILHPEFNDYFINLIIALHHAQPELIIIDHNICNHIYNSKCEEVIEMISTVFKENKLPVIHLKKDRSSNNESYHYSDVSKEIISTKLISKVHKHAKKIFSIKKQVMYPDDLLVPVAGQPHKKTFNWHNHSYNLN